MTEDEIKALIKSTLDASLPQVLEGAFAEFEPYFINKIKPATEEQPKGKPGKDDPLNARLANLEKQLEEATRREEQRIKEAQEYKFQNKLNETLAGRGNVLQQQLVAELLTNRYKDGAAEQDGEWYTKKGLKLSEAVDEFFKSESGLHFLPAKHQNGTQTPATRQVATTQSTADASAEDMLADVVW